MDVELAAVLVPYVSAVVGAYGPAVVAKVGDAALDSPADSTLELGRRLVRRLLDGQGPATEVRTAVEELAADPADDERVAALRSRLRAALSADPALAREVAGLLSAAGVAVTTPGDHSIAVRTVSGVTTGEWPIIQPR